MPIRPDETRLALRETTSLWERLAVDGKPVYLYGMGDGANKALTVLGRIGVPAAGVFASDEFVRGQTFRGWPVRRFAEVKALDPCPRVLLCFGSHDPAVLARIERLETECELYAPDLPVVWEECEIFDRNYFSKNYNEFNELYCRLADEPSRRTLRGLLDYRLSGKLSYLREIETPRAALWELLAPGPEECFLDLGAYRGDTVREFLAQTGGRYRRIDAFEPDPHSFRKLGQSLAGLPNAAAHPAAAGEGPGRMPLRAGRRGRGSCVSTNGILTAKINSVDHLLAGAPVTLAKLDVEGGESAAIAGMAQTIRRCRPRLLVSAYHRVDDLLALPRQVLALCPEYRVWLRKSPCVPAWDVDLLFQ